MFGRKFNWVFECDKTRLPSRNDSNRFTATIHSKDILTVWCSSRDVEKLNTNYMSASLRYVNLNANGIQSILYDAISLY